MDDASRVFDHFPAGHLTQRSLSVDEYSPSVQSAHSLYLEWEYLPLAQLVHEVELSQFSRLQMPYLPDDEGSDKQQLY